MSYRPETPSLPPPVVLPGLLGAAQIRSGVAIRRFLGGDALPIDATRDLGDPGLVGPDSISWPLIADPASLVGGVRALLLQACHPLVMQGVADHSSFREDPLGRLQRTIAYVSTTTYGSASEAEEITGHVRRAHAYVNGQLADGRTYTADDPRLLMWVHCSLVDSLLRAWQVYGPAPLSRVEADRFVAEQARCASLLFDGAPTSTAELRTVMAGYDDELESVEATKEAIRFLLLPPIPPVTLPAYEVLFWGATAIIEDEHRAVLGLPSVPAARLATRSAAKNLLRAWRALLPGSEVLAAAYTRAGVEPPLDYRVPARVGSRS